MKAPIATKKPKELILHNDTRIDPYFWLNERENPEVIQYLEQENAYTEFQLHSTQPFQEKLFQEIKSRIKEDDSSVPYLYNFYWYQTRYETGQEYPIYERWKEGSTQKEVLFNVNELAQNHSYFHLSGISVSPDNKFAAYGIDTVGRRIYTIYIKNLQTGEILPDTLHNTTGGSVWANDNSTLFYTVMDSALRPFQIYKHIKETDLKEDILVFEEKDELFNCSIFKSKSKQYIFIGSSSTLSDEYRFIAANQPNSPWKILQKREKNLEYSVSHFGNSFYIKTNKDGATNFKIMKTPTHQTEKEYWTEVIPHRKDVLIEDFSIFNRFLVIEEREQALLKIQIKEWDEKENFLQSYYMPFKEKVYTAYPSTNLEFETTIIRYRYTSLTTPWSTLEFDMENQTHTLLKEQEVLGGDFDKNNYVTDRIWVPSRDGEKIPVSWVRRKDTSLSPETPLLLYGYGSYGISLDPSFSSSRLSLLDRGFVYVIAHVRGGEELGRQWYEQGKFLHKKNTFFDFIDVAKYLIQEKYTSSSHLYASGGSAGGLLMGAVINLEPELFHGIIAAVPFVDVVTTMLDESIPLTTGEYEEWGNPNQPEYYFYMKSYSPYDNVSSVHYPHLLVTTGLHDSQVQYWEPAKWVAKMRDLKQGDQLLLLKTNMDAGHGGASGRFQALKEIALEYAFLCKLENINN